MQNLKKTFGGDFGKANLEKISKKVKFLDRWIITHFKILPTDDRFKQLEEETKELLFQIYLDTPTDTDHLPLIKEDLYKKRHIDASDKTKRVADKMGIDIESAISDIKGGI